MSSLPVIDPEAIRTLRALNPGDQDEFLRESGGSFLEDMPRRLTELDSSLATGDAAKFSRAAHSIKGSSGNLGAMALREVAGNLEQRSQKAGLGDVAGLLNELKVQFEFATAELTRLLGT